MESENYSWCADASNANIFPSVMILCIKNDKNVEDKTQIKNEGQCRAKSNDSKFKSKMKVC